jgi:soluble cytochrome b562
MRSVVKLNRGGFKGMGSLLEAYDKVLKELQEGKIVEVEMEKKPVKTYRPNYQEREPGEEG